MEGGAERGGEAEGRDTEGRGVFPSLVTSTDRLSTRSIFEAVGVNYPADILHRVPSPLSAAPVLFNLFD